MGEVVRSGRNLKRKKDKKKRQKPGNPKREGNIKEGQGKPGKKSKITAQQHEEKSGKKKANGV